MGFGEQERPLRTFTKYIRRHGDDDREKPIESSPTTLEATDTGRGNVMPRHPALT